MVAIVSTIPILDKDDATKLIHELDTSGTGAGPWRTIVHPSFGDLEAIYWSYAAASGGILNTTTAVTIKAAAGGSLRNYITGVQIQAEALTTATEFAIRDGASGTVLWRIKIAGPAHGWTNIVFDTPIKGTANTLLEVVTLTASGAGAVYFNAQGFVAA
jgi:hypothetical protein